MPRYSRGVSSFLSTLSAIASKYTRVAPLFFSGFAMKESNFGVHSFSSFWPFPPQNFRICCFNSNPPKMNHQPNTAESGSDEEKSHQLLEAPFQCFLYIPVSERFSPTSVSQSHSVVFVNVRWGVKWKTFANSWNFDSQFAICSAITFFVFLVCNHQCNISATIRHFGPLIGNKTRKKFLFTKSYQTYFLSLFFSQNAYIVTHPFPPAYFRVWNGQPNGLPGV